MYCLLNHRQQMRQKHRLNHTTYAILITHGTKNSWLYCTFKLKLADVSPQRLATAINHIASRKEVCAIQLKALAPNRLATPVGSTARATFTFEWSSNWISSHKPWPHCKCNHRLGHMQHPHIGTCITIPFFLCECSFLKTPPIRQHNTRLHTLRRHVHPRRHLRHASSDRCQDTFHLQTVNMYSSMAARQLWLAIVHASSLEKNEIKLHLYSVIYGTCAMRLHCVVPVDVARVAVSRRFRINESQTAHILYSNHRNSTQTLCIQSLVWNHDPRRAALHHRHHHLRRSRRLGRLV